MLESESQLHRKQEHAVDETAQRKTTATSEEEEGAWVRIRRDDLYVLQDKARAVGKADKEMMSREAFGTQMHSKHTGGSPAQGRGTYSKFGGGQYSQSKRQSQRPDYDSASYGESRSGYGQHQHYGY